MIPASVIISEISNQVNEEGRTATDEQWKDKMIEKVNQAYYSVVMENNANWITLQDTATVDTSDGYLPSDLLRISSVKDSDNNRYHYIQEPEITSPYYYNWTFGDPVSSVLNSGSLASVNESSTNVTSNAEFPATDCSGEYIRFYHNQGIYKIASWSSTSALTLEMKFRGQSASGEYEIRPIGTPTIAVYDNAGNSLTGKTLTIKYIRFPRPIHSAQDMIMLPGDCGAVKVRALQYVLALKTYSRAANELETRFRRELAKMNGNMAHGVRTIAPGLFRQRNRYYNWQLHTIVGTNNI